MATPSCNQPWTACSWLLWLIDQVANSWQAAVSEKVIHYNFRVGIQQVVSQLSGIEKETVFRERQYDSSSKWARIHKNPWSMVYSSQNLLWQKTFAKAGTIYCQQCSLTAWRSNYERKIKAKLSHTACLVRITGTFRSDGDFSPDREQHLICRPQGLFLCTLRNLGLLRGDGDIPSLAKESLSDFASAKERTCMSKLLSNPPHAAVAAANRKAIQFLKGQSCHIGSLTV